MGRICDYFTGKCKSCINGNYGFNCTKLCSTKCGGNGACKLDSGNCDSGCKRGFWGQKCKQKCNENCNNGCKRDGGNCDSGCKPGFWGQKCQLNCKRNCNYGTCKKTSGDCYSCKPGYHGTNCSSKCSENCGGEGKPCNFTTGLCDTCLAGFYGDSCAQKCSRNCFRSDKSCDRRTGACDEGCLPGYSLSKCEQECPAGKYGANCSSTCSQNCTNQICDHVTGKCDSCPNGTYGFNCTELCNTNCGGNKKCGRDSGYCEFGCRPGFWGQKCIPNCEKKCKGNCERNTGNCHRCKPGFWGFKCKQNCMKNCKGKCNKGSGNCFSCIPGYHGTNCSSKCSENCGGEGKPCTFTTGFCDTCLSGFYGDSCALKCSRNCFRSDKSCDRRTGACDEGCLPGYSLSKCEQECPAGKYGANCSSTCSQNCTKSNQICDHITGKCESCPTGTYGFNCSELCSTNCGGNKRCGRDSGYCEIGCKPGFWGQKCIHNCEKNCKGNCERNTGNCYRCKRGFWGYKCKRNCGENCKGKCKRGRGNCFSCKPGYYGARCLSNCSKNCGGEDNSCNFKTGMCNVCLPGFHGDFCKQSCSRNCFRVDNSCDQKTKTCVGGCVSGYKQPTCEQACDIGRYGKGCMKICSEHCGGEENSCDHVSGTCRLGCDPGYRGLLCEQECRETTWGQNCTQSCNMTCQNNTCHHVTGMCDECLPGYLGEFCDLECNETAHGLNCAKFCDTNCLSSRCHHVTGKCYSCTEGKTGDFCHLLKQKEDESRNKMTFIIIGLVCLLVIIFLAVCVVAYRRIKKRDRADNGICLNELPDGSGQEDLAPATTGRRTKEKRNILTRVKLPLELSLRGAFNFGQERENAAPCRANATASTSQANPTEFENTAIPVGNLKNHILQHSNDTHFEEEFSSVPMRNGSLQTYGALPENAKKNRYKNIIPYDTNRVQLQAKQGKKNSEYINASYIKGHKSNRAFIASQGPNDAMLHDFVRMLWEQRVEKVVMLTNLIEEGKKKCSMYWPTDGEKQFDEVAVRLLTTHVYAEYTIRNLRLSKSGKSPRDLTQFHFTAWPDQSVPESPWGLVDLYQRVAALQGNGPVLVHCSAGVGRTGTFIALCNLLQEAETTGKMDFQSTLWGLRQDRMNTIQTLEQYSYLHRVALVGYMIADTTVSVAYLRCRMFCLESEKGGTKSTRNYKQEFEAIVEVCDATAGKQAEPLVEEQRKDVCQNLKDTNIKSKDRLSNILPKPGYRPDLTAEIHHEDTYINAVLVPNLIQDRHDMLTQLPLPSTVTDFWRLVLQYNVSLVVAFDTDLKDTDETIGDFLPKSETEPFENERFTIKTEKPVERRVVTEFSLTLQQKVMPDSDITTPQTKKLTLLLCKTVQMDPSSVLEIHEQIQAHKHLDSIRTVYMCRNGADKCGLMCIQSILLDRMKLDQCLTVPLVVGKIKAIRPQAIPTVEQYKCLYQVLRRAYETQNEYMNIGGASST